MIVFHTSTGQFSLHPARRQLMAEGRQVELGARALDLLVAFAARPGEVLTKGELFDRVWPGLVVEEGNLPVQVSTLRRVLGRDAIITVPGRGYQFAGHLEGAPRRDSNLRVDAGVVPITGREADLAAVQALLDATPLVTVTGAGGSGKTLLARHMQRQRAARHRHGSAWVDLRDVIADSEVPAAAAAALDLTIGRRSAAAIARGVCDWDMLLILDNAEHVLPGATELATAVLAAAPGVRLLVTSQAPLKLPLERVHLLRGLPVPDLPCAPAQALSHGAVALFVEKARAASRRFVFDERSVDDVVAICRSLGGSALGVQLAAALLAVLPLPTVSSTLARPDVGPEAGAVDGRMNVLQAALEWSHALLGPAEQTTFRRLAALIGAVPLELALDLVRDEGLDAVAAAEALSALVERALVEPEPGHTPRYRLLDAPRALALERLRDSGEAGRLRARMAAQLASRADALRHARRDEDGATRRARQVALASPADTRATFEWAVSNDAAAAVHIGATLTDSLRVAADRVDAADALQALVDTGGLDVGLQARACEAQAVLLAHSDLARRARVSRRAAECHTSCGDTFSAFALWCTAAESAALNGRLDDGRDALHHARRLHDPAWPAVRRRLLASAEGTIASVADEPTLAIEAWQQLAEMNRACGLSNARELAAVADAELVAGRARDARRHLEEAERLLDGPRQEHDRVAYVLPNLCAACLLVGDLPAARATAARGWADARRFDSDPWWADHLALLAALEGRGRSASLLLGLSDAAYARIHADRHALEERSARQAADVAAAQLGSAACRALRAEGADPALAAQIESLALAATDAPDDLGPMARVNGTPR